ncbi:hypothetical protein TNCT_220421, partial [Trichonephila clavata]
MFLKSTRPRSLEPPLNLIFLEENRLNASSIGMLRKS